jgi:dihydroneopterin aldolase
MDDPKVDNATVEVDKPHALRFADSVTATVHADRAQYQKG